MAEFTLEQRVAALEQIVAELQRKLACSQPTGKWWERFPHMTPEERAAFDEMSAYGRYVRKTGREAPSNWNPGDPIPEPDEPQS